MRISDWSSDVCSSDVEPQCLRIGEAKRAMEMTEVLADRERRRGEQPGPRIGFAHALEIVGNFDRRCVEAAAAYQRFDPAHFLAIVVLHFRSEEHTSELQSLMRISYAVLCLKK